MKKRLASSAALISVTAAVFALWGAGGGAWILAALAALTQIELYDILNRAGCRPFARLGPALGFLMVAGSYHLPRHSSQLAVEAGAELFLIAVVICCLAAVLSNEANNVVKTLMPTLFGLLYAPFLLQFYVILLRLAPAENQGLFLVLWVVAAAKFSDIGAFLFGTIFGQHKLAPARSPKKTWEGAAGGLATALIAGLAFIYFFRDRFPPAFSLWRTAVFAVLVAVAAMLSDLIESTLKREAGVKDSGFCVPGIGGAFDLTDSLLLPAPLAYFLFRYFLL